MCLYVRRLWLCSCWLLGFYLQWCYWIKKVWGKKRWTRLVCETLRRAAISVLSPTRWGWLVVLRPTTSYHASKMAFCFSKPPFHMIDNKCSNTLFIKSSSQCIVTWGGQMEIDLQIKQLVADLIIVFAKYILNWMVICQSSFDHFYITIQPSSNWSCPNFFCQLQKIFLVSKMNQTLRFSFLNTFAFILVQND